MNTILFIISFDFIARAKKERIQKRLNSPLQRWKVSPVDLVAQEKWEDFTKYKKAMFEYTNTTISPWIIVRSPERERSRIEAMKYILSLVDYEGKSANLTPPKEHELFSYRPY